MPKVDLFNQNGEKVGERPSWVLQAHPRRMTAFPAQMAGAHSRRGQEGGSEGPTHWVLAPTSLRSLVFS